MLPFPVDLRGSTPVYEQVVYAVQKALVAGLLLPGDRFPSVRQLSTDLRINPNTAHKVVAHLTQQGLLEVRAGIGTIVAEPSTASTQAREDLLGHDLEKLIVRAKQLGISKSNFLQNLHHYWKELDSP